MLPFVTLLIEMYILHSASYSDVSTDVAHGESPSQIHCSALFGRLIPKPKQSAQKYIHILVKSIPEKSVPPLV